MTTLTESQPKQAAAEQDDKVVIRLDHVFKSFGSRLVLNDVSMEVLAEQCFGILGRSGVGKSVSLSLMIGLLAPDRGHVLVTQKDVSQLDRNNLMEVRKQIGFLFQSAALFDSLSVGQNVAFPLRRHTSKPEREIQQLVQRALEDVELAKATNKMPAELSGGMRKRVALARALILDPPIVLVDEPSSGLDTITAAEIYDLLRKLKDRKKTLVIVTHDGSAMRGIVEQLVVLDRGSIVANGSPEDLAQSDNTLVRALVAGRER
jgi:phospholipid/cholesterol/gamma-HCH transport system ATP-binding protein